jgi:hypothetical protein
MKIIEFKYSRQFPAYLNLVRGILTEYPSLTVLSSDQWSAHIEKELNTFNAKLINSSIRRIEFKTEEDYLYFCLKWS